jgi:hypothetical protein
MNKILLAVIGIIITTSAFYGGMKYDQNQTAVARTAARAQCGGGVGVAGGRGLRGGGVSEGFASGEVIAKDDKSITIKLRDGGSKIIFLSGSTEVTKSAQGSAQDISIGTQISTNGTANSDGSVTAQMIQIRPKTPTSNQ